MEQRVAGRGAVPGWNITQINVRLALCLAPHAAAVSAFREKVRAPLASKSYHLYLVVLLRPITLRGFQSFEAVIGISISPALPHRRYPVGKLVVCCATPHQPLQVVTGLGEKAGYQFPIGGKAGASAARAKRFGNRGDDADVALAIDKLEVQGWSAARAPAAFRDRIPGADDIQYLSLGHHPRSLPVVAITDIHELDESQTETICSAKLNKVQDSVIIDSPLNYGVDFDGAETGIAGGENALEYLSQVATLAHGLELLGIEGIDADVDPPQAR